MSSKERPSPQSAAAPVRRSGTEKELVARLLAGDEATFNEIVTRYHGQLRRVARVFVSSDAVAEEVAQETWLAVLDGLRRFEGRSSLKTWIFRILTNRAKTRGVREGRSIPFSALGDADQEGAVDPSRFNDKGSWTAPPQPWDLEAPDKLALNKETRGVIEQAIAELPSNQAAVVTLRDVQGWASDEVCQLLGVSESNQRVLLHRARGKLRRVLESYLEGERR